MKKASEYARHAQECRMLAAQMKTGEQREQLGPVDVQREAMIAAARWIVAV